MPATRDPRATRRPAIALAALCATQFVLILDVAVVNVALVPLADDLAASAQDLHLVASVYAATFGGLLLVAGRIADSGRRRGLFLVGIGVFAVASVICAVAWSVPALIVGRALQGVGAAAASPAALSLLTTIFAEGGPRERALGLWASVAAAGGAAGLVLGGLLVVSTGWRSVFLVNVPIVVAVFAVALWALPADPRGRRSGSPPSVALVPAAASVTAVVAGLAALSAVEAGAPATVAVSAVVAVAALVVFVRTDARTPAPLAPPGVVRRRSVLAANGATLAMSAVVLGVNFFLAVHLQQGLGFSPLAAGLAFLPITGVSAVTAIAASRLVTRLGARRLLVAGLAVMALGCLLLTGVGDDGTYAARVLPGMVLVAAGMGPGFAVGTVAATAGVPAAEQGAAAALLSTSTQVGAALGLAGLAAVAGAADAVPATSAAFAAMTVLAVLATAAAAALPADRRRAARALPVLPAQAAGCLPGCLDPALRPTAVPGSTPTT